MPCLAGIAAHDLVHLYAITGGARLALLDRGWCNRCSVSGRKTAQQALDDARALLAELGVPNEQLPGFVKRPLPPEAIPAEIPEPIAAEPLARRAFLRSLPRGAARMLTPFQNRRNTADAGATRRGTITALPRLRLLNNAAAIAGKHARAVPARLFPRVSISEACSNHQVCAAICPTGALQPFRAADGPVAGITFNASTCVSCGDCVRGCREAAVKLQARSKGCVAPGPVRLTRWTLRECCDCAEEFADAQGTTVCPACRKTSDLARSTFLRH